jgi:hypothetical protein
MTTASSSTPPPTVEEVLDLKTDDDRFGFFLFMLIAPWARAVEYYGYRKELLFPEHKVGPYRLVKVNKKEEEKERPPSAKEDLGSLFGV